MLFDRVRWKAAIVWDWPASPRRRSAHKIENLENNKNNNTQPRTQPTKPNENQTMLFLYHPVPSLVRKHGTAFGSIFDDADFTTSRHRRVERSSFQRQLNHGEDDDNNNAVSGAFQYTLAVPGVKSSDIQVTVEQNVLTIHGETKNHRQFRKIMTVNTDETDLSQLTAQLSDGVLTLTAPPKAKLAPLPIHVTSNNDIEQDEKEEQSSENDETMMMRRSIEIPGVKHSDLQVTLEEGTTLHVRGVRRGKAFDQKFRIIDADKINPSALTANLSHGILTVRAPMVPKPVPHTVPIEANAADNSNADTTTRTDAYVLVSVDLPGVRLPNVTVTTVRVDQRQTALDIRASRHHHNNNKKLRISKLILLDHDTYNVDELKAQLSDGVLTITAPKKFEALPRAIPIVTTTAQEHHPPKEAAMADEQSKETNAIVPTEANVTRETTK
jgi:HSP20 family molecular chaperone IbpA